MTTYMIATIDPVSGRQSSERIEAETAELAGSHVAARGLTVLSISKQGLSLTGDLPFAKARVKPKDLALFARQFATLIDSAMPMLRAMTVMIKQTENPALRSTLERVLTELEAGSKLSDAMSEHKSVFPPLMLSMIKSGEVGGFLEKALLEVATTLEKEVKLRRQVVSAMTYPVVVLIMALIGTVAMLVFVVPTFAKMFADLGGELPLLTRVVMKMSTIEKYAALPEVAGTIAFLFWWRGHKHDERVRRIVDPLKLRAPIFGSLTRKIALSRFSRNLSVMLHSGVSILNALTVVAETADNIVIRDAVLRASEKVRGGGQLSEHLGDGGVIPDMLVQMVAVGEETGETDEMLLKAATFYDDEVEATTDQLAALIEPVMIGLVASILGVLVIAMYLPIFDVINLVHA